VRPFFSVDPLQLRLHQPPDLGAKFDSVVETVLTERNESAVDDQIVAGDERRGVARQIHRPPSDIVGLTGARNDLRRGEQVEMTPATRSAFAPSRPAVLAKMPVTMPPGEIVFRRTPREPSSEATQRDN
jgi:hypothetical protein